ncbi:protein ACCELERATED CELL DEATH 6-like isoform X2 [Typha angustifolia]|uniref:protein ACCELERATED CELL DEATH 6-like isoform X2 n=1 Tax=Typha angustifolia TaxID=59011 RepID=UPI003C2C17CC
MKRCDMYYSQTQVHQIGPQRIPMDPKLLKAARTGDQSLLERLLPSVATTEIAIAVPNNGDVLPAQDDPEASILLGVTIGGNTALHIAATHGRLELAQLICQRERSLVVARNVMLETPLHCAARAGHHQIISSIVSFSKDDGAGVGVGVETVLRAKNRDGETALHEAVRHGHVDVAVVLMSADPGLANMVDERGISPLYLAATAGSLALLHAILRSSSTTLTAASSFPVSYAGPNGQTALHAAAFLQNSEIAEELLKWNQMLAQSADNSGSTPFHYAASTGNEKMVKLLLAHDTSQAYVADSGGLFPVHVAAIRGRFSVIDKLLRHCPDSDELLDNKGRNLLHTAVEHRRKEVVRYVCERPELAKLMNDRDYEGNTPLHLAVSSGEQGIVSLLMQNSKVHSSIMNKEGLTPLDLSIIGSDDDLNYYLTGALASPRRVDHFLRDYIIRTDLEKESKKHAYMNQSIVIASVLIATVTFAAAFTMPGGYRADGTPTLARRYTFKAFIVADTLAFICSMLSTCWITFGGSVLLHPWLRRYYVVGSQALLMWATRSMVAAFALAVYLVLAPISNSIGIVVAVTTSTLYLLDTPNLTQICTLAITVKSRVGWTGLFKSRVLPFARSWVHWQVDLNMGRRIFARILNGSWIFIIIFLIALL